jgi:hypothetical protein
MGSRLTFMRVRFPGLALALSVCSGALAALVVSVDAAPNGGDCDNMAGECLRQRQGFAITLIEAACLASFVVAAAYFVLQWRGRSLSRKALSALAMCGLLVTLVLVVQPVGHLNNRWSGWLGA